MKNDYSKLQSIEGLHVVYLVKYVFWNTDGRHVYFKIGVSSNIMNRMHMLRQHLKDGDLELYKVQILPTRAAADVYEKQVQFELRKQGWGLDKKEIWKHAIPKLTNRDNWLGSTEWFIDMEDLHISMYLDKCFTVKIWLEINKLISPEYYGDMLGITIRQNGGAHESPYI